MKAKRRVKWTSSAAVASALWLVVASAAAQGPNRARAERSFGDGPQRMLPAERGEEQMNLRDSTVSRPPQRLSAEERRQLRHDVHEAGRDLYGERMRPARRPLHRE